MVWRIECLEVRDAAHVRRGLSPIGEYCHYRNEKTPMKMLSPVDVKVL
jgi:hypothetical protein